MAGVELPGMALYAVPGSAYFVDAARWVKKEFLNSRALDSHFRFWNDRKGRKSTHTKKPGQCPAFS